MTNEIITKAMIEEMIEGDVEEIASDRYGTLYIKRIGKMRILAQSGGSLLVSTLTGLTLAAGDRPSGGLFAPFDYFGSIGRIRLDSNGKFKIEYRATYGSNTVTDAPSSHTVTFPNMIWFVA